MGGSLAYVIAMAPRETQALPCGSTSLAHLKVLDKALQLPVVSDVASKLAGHQLKAVVEGVSSLVTQAEESLVPLLPARLRHCSDTAKEKVGSAVEGLDSLACDGLDQLTSNILALKENTSELCEVTKDAVYSYLERTKDYLASFTVAQKTLLLGDRALQATSDAVQYSGLGSKVEVKSVLCVNFFLSYVGLKIVPAHLRKEETTGSLESSVEEESVEEKLSDADKMVNNKSDEEDLDFQPYEHKAEDEIVEISDDKEIQVVEAIGVEASIHPMKNDDLDDEDNEIQLIDVVGDDSKPMLVKIENEDMVNGELKDAAAIQADSASNDIECVAIVESVEVEAPKEISFDQLLEFHKAEQEKAKLESLVSWSADALTEQLESASASLGEKVINTGGEEYLVLSEENAAEIVSVPDEVKDPLAHREKLESDDNSSEEEAVAEEDEVDDVQVIDEYDPLADAIGAMNMAEAEDKTDDDDDIQEASSDFSDSDIN